MDQNISNLDLKLLTDSADTTLSGKLFHTDTARFCLPQYDNKYVFCKVSEITDNGR